MLMVNSHGAAARVAPPGGRVPRLSTNPLAIGVPNGDEPLVLDFSTSATAEGKVRVKKIAGERTPEGWLLDSQGKPTTDPNVMFTDTERGALLPTGAHKGYGLMLACELLAGVLSGGGTIQPDSPREGAIVNNMLTVLIDPQRLVDLDWMAREIDAMVAYAKASPAANAAEPVLVAGDPERQHAADRHEHGIPVDPTTWRELEEAAEAVGLSVAKLRELARSSQNGR